MSHEVFTQRWAQAWADELRASPDYRSAAIKWEGSLLLEMEADPEQGVGDDRAVFLDLWHGDCRSARVADEFDKEDATYVIRARARQWKRVLDGEIEPIMGLMSGKLKLKRGSLAKLTPYMKASKELLAAASRLGSHFPGEAPATSDDNGDQDVRESAPEALRVVAAPSAAAVSSSAVSSSAASSSAAPSSETSPSEAIRMATVTPIHAARVLQTTSSRGLDHNLPPMRLWHKAKRLGIWDPQGINMSHDRIDWQRLAPLEKELLLHLASLFQAGEEAVTLDLLPLILVIAREGRLEEEMYLTSFLWEEAKHVELFRRFLDEVAMEKGDLTRFHGPSYRAIFYEKLPDALQQLHYDPSPQAQAAASVTYNMIVEGVLAETGYHAYHKILVRHEILPGMQQAVSYLKSDEARHLAYGVFLLSRLVAENGDPVWRVIERRMDELLPVALGLIRESLERYERLPFGLRLEDFTDFATAQFERRFERIEKSRRQTLEEICRLPALDEGVSA